MKVNEEKRGRMVLNAKDMPDDLQEGTIVENINEVISEIDESDIIDGYFQLK